MTHCYNCGHTGTFVLLAQFALAVPGPDADADRDAAALSKAADRNIASDADADRDAVADRDTASGAPDSDGLSLAVQCPACDSTDVGVPASDLLARYGATTTS